MYIDIHTHSFYKRNEVIILQNLFPWEINQVDRNNYYSLGLHPWHVNENTLYQNMAILEQHAPDNTIIAIGEIGLDTNIDVPYGLQKKVFSQQIHIAERLNKPIVIHCVKAYNDLLVFRKESDTSIPWIIHWFGANLQIAEALIEKNCFLSYGVNIFAEKSKAFLAFTSLPPSQLFFETDDSKYSIENVYNKAAFLKKMELSELQMQIMKNFQLCFNFIPT